MTTGTIVRIFPEKGFGFISRARQPNIFFHIRDTEFTDDDFTESLLEMDVVFQEDADPRGRVRAVNVRPARR